MSTEPMASEVLAPPATPAAAADPASAAPTEAVAAPAVPGTAAPVAAKAVAAGRVAAGAAAMEPSSPRRRTRVHAVARRVVGFAVMVGLLVGGIALGATAFANSQPALTVVGDPVTNGVQAPPSVTELAAAFMTNDADSVRSAVPGDAYGRLTSELERWNVQEITLVETLSTYVDGPRGATQLVIIGRATNGNPVTINLIVHTVVGAIESFR